MIWNTPTFDEVKMDAEIGSYNEDDDPSRDPNFIRASVDRPHSASLAQSTTIQLGEMPKTRAGTRSKAMRAGPLAIFGVAALVTGYGLAAAKEAHAFTPANVLTRNYDNLRTNTNLGESILTQSNVASDYFGKLALQFQVDDQVYAQVLYASAVNIGNGGSPVNVAYVATANNTVYAFNADTGSLVWSMSLNNGGRPPKGSEVGGGCGDFSFFPGGSSDVGIIGTPVIDSSTNTLYVVAHTLESGNQIYRLWALDSTGGGSTKGKSKGNMVISPGTGFSAAFQNQRPGLALSPNPTGGASVYVGFAGYCDNAPYHGWLVAYDGTTLKQTGAFNSTPQSGASQGGIWQGGNAPAIDFIKGNVYVATGNGTFTSGANANFGDSVIELAPKTLKVLASFTPDPTTIPCQFSSYPDYLNGNDFDIGMAGPSFLPLSQKNVLIEGSKLGIVYVMGTLGGYKSGDPNVQEFNAVPFVGNQCDGNNYSGHMTQVVTWNSPQGMNMYTWGEHSDPMGYRYNITTGLFNTTAVISNTTLPSHSATVSGAIMALSANAAQSGTGIVWGTNPASSSATTYTLYALNAETLVELYSSDTNASDKLTGTAHWTPPTVANGKVYTPSFSKTVSVFGLRPPTSPTWVTNSGLANAIGSGWAIGNNAVGHGDYGIFHWDPVQQQWVQIPNAGAQVISVDLNGTPWIVNLAGQIYKWNGTAFSSFGSGLAASRVASGATDTETWALRQSDGQIFHWTGTQWTSVPGAGLQIAVFSAQDPVCGDHLPVVIQTDAGHEFNFFSHGSSCQTGGFNTTNGAGSDLSTDFAVGTDGNIYQWNAATKIWGFYVAAPFGTDTNIGTWINGMFARSSLNGQIQLIR